MLCQFANGANMTLKVTDYFLFLFLSIYLVVILYESMCVTL